jgi:hypothetical protein
VERVRLTGIELERKRDCKKERLNGRETETKNQRG